MEGRLNRLAVPARSRLSSPASSAAALQLHPRGLPADHLDLPRRHAGAQRLDHRLLGGEPRREVAAGPGAPARVGQLTRREEAIREARAPFEGALQAFNLDQVDADGGGHG
jgi:hypothetical protein